MANSLVLTICAHDRPGVMKLISKTITESDGNWLESRMARLGGQFAGIVRIECSEDKLSQLTENLQSLSSEGISVEIHDQGDLSDYPYTRCLRLDIYGNDRPGIVSQLTQAVSSAGANIEELNTSIESAAMAGHPIFHASGTVCVPDSTDEQELISAVEALSDDLNVEIGEIV
ncbi:MAG: ACT domain-containing protein [Akkermansiaceae bacterium]|nr:ACT domain-containing protein [Akkermansiaceae bacterium]